MKNTISDIHFDFQHFNKSIQIKSSRNKNILKNVLFSSILFGALQSYDYFNFQSSVSAYMETKVSIKQEVVKNIKLYKSALRNNDVNNAIKSIETMKLLTRHNIENDKFIIDRETTPDLFVAATYLNVLTSDQLVMSKDGKTEEVKPYPQKLIDYIKQDKEFISNIDNFNMLEYKCSWYSITCNLAKENLNDSLVKQIEEDKMVLFHNKQEILYAASHSKEYADYIQDINKWHQNKRTSPMPYSPFYLYQNPGAK